MPSNWERERHRKEMREKKFEEGKDPIKAKSMIERINKLMRNLPKDMMYVVRASNLVAIHNIVLGGDQRERIMSFTDVVFEEVYQNSPVRRMIMYRIFRMKLFIFENLFNVYQMFFKPKIEVF
jgi:hypothetical protein